MLTNEFFCLGDAAWYVIMVPACCLHPPSSVLRSMATSRRRYGPSSNWRRNDVKSWDESFLSGVPRRGNCFFPLSLPAAVFLRMLWLPCVLVTQSKEWSLANGAEPGCCCVALRMGDSFQVEVGWMASS